MFLRILILVEECEYPRTIVLFHALVLNHGNVRLRPVCEVTSVWQRLPLRFGTLPDCWVHRCCSGYRCLRTAQSCLSCRILCPGQATFPWNILFEEILDTCLVRRSHIIPLTATGIRLVMAYAIIMIPCIALRELYLYSLQASALSHGSLPIAWPSTAICDTLSISESRSYGLLPTSSYKVEILFAPIASQRTSHLTSHCHSTRLWHHNGRTRLQSWSLRRCISSSHPMDWRHSAISSGIWPWNKPQKSIYYSPDKWALRSSSWSLKKRSQCQALSSRCTCHLCFHFPFSVTNAKSYTQ